MQCPRCGFWNADDAKECTSCGINLAWAVENITETCPACNTANPVVSTRCSNCGLNLQLVREQKKLREDEQRRQDEERKRQEEERRREEENDRERLAEIRAAGSPATNALVSAIVGFFICAIVLGPYAISQARKAKRVLGPGDPGYGRAQAGEILGWIGLALWVLYIVGAIIGALAD